MNSEIGARLISPCTFSRPATFDYRRLAIGFAIGPSPHINLRQEDAKRRLPDPNLRPEDLYLVVELEYKGKTVVVYQTDDCTSWFQEEQGEKADTASVVLTSDFILENSSGWDFTLTLRLFRKDTGQSCCVYRGIKEFNSDSEMFPFNSKPSYYNIYWNSRDIPIHNYHLAPNSKGDIARQVMAIISATRLIMTTTSTLVPELEQDKEDMRIAFLEECGEYKMKTVHETKRFRMTKMMIVPQCMFTDWEGEIFTPSGRDLLHILDGLSWM